MAKVNYAIVGFGGIAENRIAKEGFALDSGRFKAHPTATAVGATDLNPARREAAEALGLRWFASAGEAIASPDVQAVFIATNNASHAAVAEQAIRAGKHCLIEKPIAATLSDAKALSALARERGVSLAVDHMMTRNVLNVKARALIDAGALGTVNDVRAHMEFPYGFAPEEAATWRCSDIRELGGPIGDVASHCFYLIEFLLDDEIVSLACAYYPKTMAIKVEDGAYIKVKTRKGVTGSVGVAFSEPRGGALKPILSNLGYEIYGDQAVVRGYATMFQLSGHSDEPIRPRLVLDNFTTFENVTADSPPRNIYQEMIDSHARSILEKKPMTGADAVHNLELVLAAHESAQAQGKTIKVG